MTDEIMIDNIDVSSCKYYMHGTTKCKGSVDTYDQYCINNFFCYYKQLKRIEAEYKKFSEYLPIAARLAKRFETLEEAKGIEYDGILSEFLAENEKLKNTLKEIAEIATVWLKNDWSCYHCRKNMDEHLKQIIDRAKRS